LLPTYSVVCMSAGAASLPHTGSSCARGQMPGWIEYVAPFRDKDICGVKFGLNLVDPGMV